MVVDPDNVDSSLLLRSFDHAGRNPQPEGREVLRYLLLKGLIEAAHLRGLQALFLLEPPSLLVDLILLLRNEELSVKADKLEDIALVLLPGVHLREFKASAGDTVDLIIVFLGPLDFLLEV